MSDPQVKAERSAAKDARQQPAPDAPSTGKKKRKRDKPWVVEARYTGTKSSLWFTLFGNEWRVQRRYAKESDALAMVEKLKKERYSLDSWEYRIVEKS